MSNNQFYSHKCEAAISLLVANNLYNFYREDSRTSGFPRGAFRASRPEARRNSAEWFAAVNSCKTVDTIVPPISISFPTTNTNIICGVDCEVWPDLTTLIIIRALGQGCEEPLTMRFKCAEGTWEALPLKCTREQLPVGEILIESQDSILEMLSRLSLTKADTGEVSYLRR